MIKLITKAGILFLLIFLVQSVAMAGKPFEGVITFTVSYSDTKLQESQLSMLPKIMTVSIKGTKSRVDINSAMGNQVTLNDYNEKTVAVLFDMMGQKYAIKKTSQDLAKEFAKEPPAKVTETGETKVIAGFNCKKAVVTTDQDGEKTSYDVYYTKEIGGKEANFDNPLYKDIDGVMMEFSMKTGQFSMKFTATSAEKKGLDSKIFEIPSDYKITTAEEFKALMGGGGE